MAEAPEIKYLIDDILAGNTNGYQTFIEHYQRLVCHIVFRMVANKSDREDLCQEVFIKAYQNLASFQFKSKVSTWLATIAYNSCINHLSKRKVLLFDDLVTDEKSLDGFTADHISPYDYTADGDIFSRLQKEIEKLPIQYRTILTLYHLDEMSYAEIGEIMRLPEGTVKSYLFRARKCLKELLLQEYHQEVL